MLWLDKEGQILKNSWFNNDSYIIEFLNNNSLRKSCPRCQYCTPQRAFDITVGDFWAITPKNPVYDDRGVSFLLCNTQKGLDWLRANEDEFATLERGFLKDVAQACFWRPYFRGKQRAKLFKSLRKC